MLGTQLGNGEIFMFRPNIFIDFLKFSFKMSQAIFKILLKVQNARFCSSNMLVTKLKLKRFEKKLYYTSW